MSGAEHTNNWAVLVCTSTFWFNYRHIANVLSIYHIIKRLGIADDHIILMLADDAACNVRNALPATVYNHYNHKLNVYDNQVEVDYRGSEVTVENFIRLLTNRLPVGTPRSKRLATDEGSNILVYMTGHGGDDFLKFQDTEEINAHDLGDAFNQMYEARRYKEILFMIDTCQASTMSSQLTAPGVTAIASSVKGESSYSYHVDDVLGVPVLDRFTWSLLEFTKSLDATSMLTVSDLYDSLDPNFLSSHPNMMQTDGSSPPELMKVVDFFGNVPLVDTDVEPAESNRFKSEIVFDFKPKFKLDPLESPLDLLNRDFSDLKMHVETQHLLYYVGTLVFLLLSLYIFFSYRFTCSSIGKIKVN